MSMNWAKNREAEVGKLFDLLNSKFSLSKEDLISKSRKKEYVHARKIFMNILYEVFNPLDKNLVQSDISEIINRDRTSFIHHRKEHLGEYKQYKKYREDYECLNKEYEKAIL